MSNFQPIYWDSQYCFVSPDDWRRARDGCFRHYVVLDWWEARSVLKRLAREDAQSFFKLAYRCHPLWRSVWGFAPNSYAEHVELGRLHRALEPALGTVFSKPGEPPDFARLYVCRAKPLVPASATSVVQHVTRPSLEEARRAPRGYVTLEAVDPFGRPVANVKMMILLADGDLRTVVTNSVGQAHLEPIPQGQCHVRVPELDESAWKPADGSPSSPVDKGYKRTHVVQRGDCLSRIAHSYGYGDWKKIWNAPDNAELRQRRKQPTRIEPGDELVLPVAAVHEIVRPTDQLHRLIVQRRKTVLGVLNAHLLNDVTSLNVEADTGPTALSSMADVHRDDSTVALRMQTRADERSLSLNVPGQ